MKSERSLPERGDTFSVMFHYVRPVNEQGLNGLDLASFRLLLDELESKYGILKRDDWEAIKAGEMRAGCLLTFDDGLSDHWKYCLPELTERKLHAQFYVCCDPLIDAQPLSAHVAHRLLMEFDAARLVSEFRPILMERGVVTERSSSADAAYLMDQDSFAFKEFKRLINHTEFPLLTRDALSELVENLIGDSCSNFMDGWYLETQHLRQIAAMGFQVESHTCTHSLLTSKEAENRLGQEIRESRGLISEIAGYPVMEFAYPYGETDSYNLDVISVVRSSGYAVGHLAVAGKLSPRSMSMPFELPRFDGQAIWNQLRRPRLNSFS